MNSTLRPHLFFKVIDKMVLVALKRRHYDAGYSWEFMLPKYICALAASSTHAYKIVAYLLKNVLTKIVDFEGDVMFECSWGDHPLTFYMNKTHHIDALMRIAGHYCTSKSRSLEQHDIDTTDWRFPIYEGLVNNEESSDAIVFKDIIKPKLDYSNVPEKRWRVVKVSMGQFRFEEY